MKAGDLFIGPARFWLLWIIVLGVLGTLGEMQLHVFDFKLFLLILGALSGGSVAVIVLTRRPGEHVTREKLDDEMG